MCVLWDGLRDLCVTPDFGPPAQQQEFQSGDGRSQAAKPDLVPLFALPYVPNPRATPTVAHVFDETCVLPWAQVSVTEPRLGWLVHAHAMRCLPVRLDPIVGVVWCCHTQVGTCFAEEAGGMPAFREEARKSAVASAVAGTCGGTL